MSAKRILAVDYGSKRVGLALTDPLGFSAQPVPFLENKSWSFLFQEIKKLIGEKSVELILVGLPKSLDGGLGQKAQECQAFALKLGEETGLPVELRDESFTSREATEILAGEMDLSREKRKKLVDSMSACLLLRSYMIELESKRSL